MDLYWLEQSEADVPMADDWLSPGEVQCLQSMAFPKRRCDWRLGRWTAKCAVAAWMQAPAMRSEIEIRAAPSGAPQVCFPREPAAVSISLSHRAGVACCALVPGRVAVGCDLEWIEPHSLAFISDYFTLEEQVLIARTGTREQPRMVALLWSAKESALKALGAGLRYDTRSVVVDIPAVPGALSNKGGEWRRLLVRHAHHNFQGWWRTEGNLVRTVVAAPPPDLPIALVPAMAQEIL